MILVFVRTPLQDSLSLFLPLPVCLSVLLKAMHFPGGPRESHTESTTLSGPTCEVPGAA